MSTDKEPRIERGSLSGVTWFRFWRGKRFTVAFVLLDKSRQPSFEEMARHSQETYFRLNQLRNRSDDAR